MSATYQTIRTSQKVCYFLIKSFQVDHIQLSQRYNVWATSNRNEVALANAFENYDFVVLIFSVNASGKFYGYAVVTSLTGLAPPVFTGNDGKAFPGKPFAVKWISTLELPFKHFDHIVNSYNDNKPVKVGRDGQHVSVDAGNQVLDVYQTMEEQLKNQPVIKTAVVPTNVAGGWMLATAGANEELDWNTTILNVNPLLSIYPIDLTKFASYQSYCECHAASTEYVLSPEAIPPPIKGYDDWSTPNDVEALENALKQATSAT